MFWDALLHVVLFRDGGGGLLRVSGRDRIVLSDSEVLSVGCAQEIAEPLRRKLVLS